LENPYRSEFMPRCAAAGHIAEISQKANAILRLLTKV